MEELVGNLVILRPLKLKDAEITLKWRLSDYAKYLNKGATTVGEQKQWINKSIEKGEKNLLIIYRDTPVGMISLYDINLFNKSAVMGRLLIGEKTKVANAPITFEAELLVLDYAFSKMNLHKIYGDVRADNIGVNKFRKYLCWHKDGVMREHYFHDGKYEDAIMYSLLYEEYYAQCRKKIMSVLDFFQLQINENGVDK